MFLFTYIWFQLEKSILVHKTKTTIEVELNSLSSNEKIDTHFILNNHTNIFDLSSPQTKSQYTIIPIDFSRDSFVFMHIQKTSGTYWIDEMKKNLLARIDKNSDNWRPVCSVIKYAKNKERTACLLRKSRLIAEVYWHSSDSFNCDIHAGLSELQNCLKRDRIPHGNNHFLTILRDPLERYISEFEHVKRGATWSKAVRECTKERIYSKTCYQGAKDWANVTWNNFLTCEYNLANNRQVRMLANYNEIGCSSLQCFSEKFDCNTNLKAELDEKMLESAKKSLLSFTFFGLTEYQHLSFLLFEKVFDNQLKFRESFANQEVNLAGNLLNTHYSSFYMKLKIITI